MKTTVMRMALAAALAVCGLGTTGCLTMKEPEGGRTHAHRARAGRPSPQHRHKLPPPRPADETPPAESR